MITCLEHTQKGDSFGYGTTRINNKPIKLHRLAYLFAVGLSEDHILGLVVRHTCDNPRCINPQHLTVGTVQDNADDKTSKGRQAQGTDFKSSKLTDDDVRCIREEYIRGSHKFGGGALGKRYGVHKTVIIDIIAGKSWKHV